MPTSPEPRKVKERIQIGQMEERRQCRIAGEEEGAPAGFFVHFDDWILSSADRASVTES